jgi:Domain of unknown function (DUF6378)
LIAVTGSVELRAGNLTEHCQKTKLMTTTTEKLFDNVIKTIHARGVSYGHPITNHKRIAELWSAYLGYPIQPNEVAICMALVKISRQAEDPTILDNYEDCLAYISIAKTITDAMSDDRYEWKD